MKKVMTAVGLVAACVGSAQAQSSVTVYGIIDAGYIGGNNRLSSSGAATNGGQTKTTVNQFGSNAESSSRLGLKGIEDLGGGMSAYFTTEFQLEPQDQTLSGNSNAGLFNRQAFVGLKKSGVGQAAVGLQYTPIFNAGLTTDPGAFNNLAGNIIYASSKGQGAGVSAGQTYIGFTARTANTLSFKTDTFAGFTASGIYTLNNSNQSQTQTGSTISGGNINASGWGFGVDYTYNKFYIAAAYQALKQFMTEDSQSTPSATNSHEWTNAQANGATPVALKALPGGTARNVQDNQFYAGATYDFGVLKAYAQYLTRKATSTISPNYYLGRSAEQLGVRGYITPSIEAWGSAGLGRYTEMGANSPTANFNGWQVGSNYWFSKRTNLYAMYGQSIVSNATTAAGVTASASINNYGIGIRHTF